MRLVDVAGPTKETVVGTDIRSTTARTASSRSTNAKSAVSSTRATMTAPPE